MDVGDCTMHQSQQAASSQDSIRNGKVQRVKEQTRRTHNLASNRLDHGDDASDIL